MANKKASKGKGAGADSGKGAAEAKEGTSFSPSGIRLFFQEVMAEFKKIVWPVKKVTAGLTGFVLVLVVIISIYLGSVDLLLGKLVTYILN
ncbi:MAG: preprotein translocase subunit SecE [bacterium]|nr:preprotein translocase subunit SecE [bacterium]